MTNDPSAFDKWYRNRFNRPFQGVCDEDCDLEACWYAAIAAALPRVDEEMGDAAIGNDAVHGEKPDEVGAKAVSTSPTTPDHKSSLVKALEANRYKCPDCCKYTLTEAIAIVRQHESEALPRVDDAMMRKAFKRWYDASIWLGVYGGGYESLWQAWKAAIAALTTPNQQPKGE